MSEVRIGVDGCKAGWLFVRSSGDQVDFGVVKQLAELVPTGAESARIFVDIPIGLRDTSGEPRTCDQSARKVLGPRASSVFPAPLRVVLQCTSHPEANALARSACGKGMSQQAFAITPKIRDVDELVRTSTTARQTIREVHPEVCFWSLNGKLGMAHPKKKTEGFTERMNLLDRIWPESKSVADKILDKYLRKHVARDDIADALVALVTALAPQMRLRTLPAEPEIDAEGLPMEMVYAELQSSSLELGRN